MNELFNEALVCLWKVRTFEGSIALFLLERYVNGAILQYQRIQSHRAALHSSPGPPDQTTMLMLFLDIHYYFICLDKAQNLFVSLAQADGDQDLLNRSERLRPLLKPYNDARNHLEHIETRLTKQYIGDLGNLSNDEFTFGGQRFDISSRSLQLVTEAYTDWVRVIAARTT